MIASQVRLRNDRSTASDETDKEAATRSKADVIEFPVDLDLEMVLGDMPQKVMIALSNNVNRSETVMCL